LSLAFVAKNQAAENELNPVKDSMKRSRAGHAANVELDFVLFHRFVKTENLHVIIAVII
jgi:hypothetical protein